MRFNCAALTPELAEAELFGHAKGAFTGAVRARPGLFGEADGGTLLLDEVGELAPRPQAKLLRVLQEGEVRPVGEERAGTSTCACSRPRTAISHALVRAGSFREDLYYRLNVVQLRVPPLRERPEDIPVLARHFLARFAERFGARPARACPTRSSDRLAAHAWPGNVRELENAIERLVALSPPEGLDLSLLPGGDGARERGGRRALPEAARRGVRARPRRGGAPRRGREPQRGGAPARRVARHAPRQAAQVRARRGRRGAGRALTLAALVRASARRRRIHVR